MTPFLAISCITPSSSSSLPAVSLELVPSLHGNLGAVKLTLVFDACLLSLLTSSLASITPGEVIEFPEGIDRKDKVPDGEGEEIDEHPYDVRPAVSGEDNEYSGKTKDQRQEH